MAAFVVAVAAAVPVPVVPVDVVNPEASEVVFFVVPEDVVVASESSALVVEVEPDPAATSSVAVLHSPKSVAARDVALHTSSTVSMASLTDALYHE